MDRLSSPSETLYSFGIFSANRQGRGNAIDRFCAQVLTSSIFRVAWSDDETENDGGDDDDRLTAADLIPRRDVPVPTPRSPPTSKRSLVLDTTVEAEQASVPPRQLQRPPRENRYEDESESSSSYDVAEIVAAVHDFSF